LADNWEEQSVRIRPNSFTKYDSYYIGSPQRETTHVTKESKVVREVGDVSLMLLLKRK
jgi:hypothetical protein